MEVHNHGHHLWVPGILHTSRDLLIFVEEAAEPVSSEHVNGRAGGSRGVVHGRPLVQ